MRILHLAKYYPPMRGGIERFTGDLARGCAAAGDDVGVLSFHDRAETSDRAEDGVRVLRAASLGTLRSQPLSPRYLALGRDLPADILHLHEPNPAGEWVALGRGAPLVVTYHSDVVRQRWLGALLGPLRRRVLGRAFRIAVSTPAHLEALESLRPLRARCATVPFGVDPGRFRPEGPLPPALARLAEHRPLALFVGRLVPYKGLGVLLEALVGLPLQLLVVGTGPLETALKARAGALGVGDRVHWAGEVAEDDLPGCYRLADLFVLPSLDRSETFGYAMLEAMASGLPAVSSDLPGPAWVNRHGETGLVVPPGDAGALGAALGELAGDPARRRELGAAARARSVEAFSLERMVAAYRALYAEATAAR